MNKTNICCCCCWFGLTLLPMFDTGNHSFKLIRFFRARCRCCRWLVGVPARPRITLTFSFSVFFAKTMSAFMSCHHCSTSARRMPPFAHHRHYCRFIHMLCNQHFCRFPFVVAVDCCCCYFLLKLRPLRLAKIVPAFDLLMKRVHHLFSAVGNQTIIVCIFIYIFALFGCRAFGLQYVGKYGRTMYACPQQM